MYAFSSSKLKHKVRSYSYNFCARATGKLCKNNVKRLIIRELFKQKTGVDLIKKIVHFKYDQSELSED